MKYRFSGALFTLSAISWGILIWNHFSQNSPTALLLFPAILCLVVALVIELYDMD
jgi:hypothetical protein